LEKYRKSNLTIEALDAADGGADIQVDMPDVVRPKFTDSELEPGVEVIFNSELFSYEETHKVLKDGRVVEKDPVTNKWCRKASGIAKDIWLRLPSMSKSLAKMPGITVDDKDITKETSPPASGVESTPDEDTANLDSEPVLAERTKMKV